MSSCTTEALKAAVLVNDACKFVNDNCSGSEFINFFAFRYCVLQDMSTGMWILFWATMVRYADLLQVLLVATAFIMLGSVAGTYLTPVLTKVSDTLKLSETVSGVTLLAFANGAPDVLSALSAGAEEDGIYIAVGNLFGACLFSSTLVIGRCISTCPNPIVMEAQFWNRDLLFYIGTLIVVVIYGSIGSLSLWNSLTFFGIYLVYITIVIIVTLILT